MSLVNQLQDSDVAELNGSVVSSFPLSAPALAAQRASGRHVDPELIAEVTPMLLAGVIFAAAILVKVADALLGFGLSPAWPAALGVGCLGSIIGYSLFSKAGQARSHWQEPVGITKRAAVIVLLLVAGLLLATLGLLSNFGNFNALFLALWGVVSLILVLSLLSAQLYWRTHLAQGRTRRRVALYGHGKALEAAREWLEHLGKDTLVVSVHDAKLAGRAGGNANALDELVELVRTEGCDGVVLCRDAGNIRSVRDALDRLSYFPIDVRVCMDVSDLPKTVRSAEFCGSMALFGLQSPPFGPGGLILKTAIDYVLASVALVLLTPVFAVIALAIKLDSQGPVFFVQPRGGYRQRTINVYKFRTMSVLETGPEVKQAQRNDPRITRVGRFLRRTSLDELPQLLNVLKGELSLVGPRPHAVAHDLHYGAIVERYAQRHKIKPGITGWAQVNGYRSQTEDANLMRERVNYDLYYIDHWSPWLDIKILFRTVGILFGDSRAY
jgi:putative colanic acid biosynthesis UDP-glucose lipid carrier transferase